MSARSDTPVRIAFAPGRVNLIGEHTDYNDGVSLPFAIAQGVRVTAEPGGDDVRVVAGERASFDLSGERRERAGDWRDFVAGAIAELIRAGFTLHGCTLTIEGDLPVASGLSSSAALSVALCLALAGDAALRDRAGLARLCSRIENDWVGARTGLLDQLASLLGAPGRALRIDFRTLATRHVPLELGGWRLVTVDSGEPRALASSAYNERRAECERARDLLRLTSLRDAQRAMIGRLPCPLDRRVRHVLDENARVDAAVSALEAGDLPRLGALLDASHASLRDLFDASTPAVERTVERLRLGGAAGARMIGGGFGGRVLALLPPVAAVPEGALEISASRGATVREIGG